MALMTLEDEQVLGYLAFLALKPPQFHFSPIHMPAFVTVAEILVNLLDLYEVEWTSSTRDDLLPSCY